MLLGVLIGVECSATLWLAMLWVRQPVFSNIASPDGTTSVRLKGYPNRPINPITSNYVYFDFFRNGNPVATAKYLHSGDSLDPSFNDSYSQHNWVSNSVLRFSRENVSADKCDRVVVRIDSEKPITYLYIESRDLFLVFNPEPGSQFTLYAFPQALKGDLSWVEVEGEFADGQPIPWKGANFVIGSAPGPFEYQIRVTPEGPQISSPKLPVYKPNRTGGVS